MHEASLTHDLVRAIEAVAVEHGAGRVVSVKVAISPLLGMSSGALREHFAHDALGTIVQGARLEIEAMGDENYPTVGLVGGIILESIEITGGKP